MAVELYKHNAYADEQIEEKLKTSNRTCVIHPTGSGKSFIAIKWLYENRNKKCNCKCRLQSACYSDSTTAFQSHPYGRCSAR